jgi:ribosome biogenesis GTPase
MSLEGTIIKALSGFYYVQTGDGTVVSCRGRGKLRLDGEKPLVGDRVQLSLDAHGAGTVDAVLPRKNSFVRPAVSNIDLLVMLAANVNPITEPFLIDRVAAIAGDQNVEILLCLNKCDLDPADQLYKIYTHAGFRVLRTSARTGEGIEPLREAIRGRVCAFTGNSGVGKSSVLNALNPQFAIKTGEVSDKLGRGRHTTRHVELYALPDGTMIADTPGFSSFETDRMELVLKENLQYAFSDFAPFLGKCRYQDCAHIAEPGCAVREALERGELEPSRYDSYVRLYDKMKQIKLWELEKK